MASTQARIGQQALAVLDVALRVPCIFIIDAIFNSYYDPGSGWAGAMGKVLVRVMGKHLGGSAEPTTSRPASRASCDVCQLCEDLSPVRPTEAV